MAAAAAETLPISEDILVIDDESDIRDSVSTLLQALGTAFVQVPTDEKPSMRSSMPGLG